MAYGILVPQPGIEPLPLAMSVQSSPLDCQGIPLEFSVTQRVKSLPAMREIWVQSLGLEDPLGKGTDTLL